MKQTVLPYIRDIVQMIRSNPFAVAVLEDGTVIAQDMRNGNDIAAWFLLPIVPPECGKASSAVIIDDEAGKVFVSTDNGSVLLMDSVHSGEWSDVYNPIADVEPLYDISGEQLEIARDNVFVECVSRDEQPFFTVHIIVDDKLETVETNELDEALESIRGALYASRANQ